MPFLSPKIYSFIFGFHRLTWCPKWTPASSSSFIVTVANRSSCRDELVYVLTDPRTRPAVHRTAFPEQPITRTGNGFRLRVVIREKLPKRTPSRSRPGSSQVGHSQLTLYSKHQRLENWNRFRAPFCPYFFRSLARGSRVTNPAFFNRVLKSTFKSISASVIPCRTAPACPAMPPPSTLTLMSYLPPESVNWSGWRMIIRCVSF